MEEQNKLSTDDVDSEEEDYSETEEENRNNNNRRKNTRKSIQKGLEMCENRKDCSTETVKVGIQCQKLHVEEEHKELKRKTDKEEEKEQRMKKQEAKTQYCKHHMYGTCQFRNRCWKKTCKS